MWCQEAQGDQTQTRTIQKDFFALQNKLPFRLQPSDFLHFGKNTLGNKSQFLTTVYKALHDRAPSHLFNIIFYLQLLYFSHTTLSAPQTYQAQSYLRELTSLGSNAEITLSAALYARLLAYFLIVGVPHPTPAPRHSSSSCYPIVFASQNSFLFYFVLL